MFVIVLSLTVSLLSMQSFRSISGPDGGFYQDAQRHALKSDNSYAPPSKGPDNNEWTVQIISSGGVTGSGRGDLLASSDGTLSWSSSDVSCSRRLTDEATQILAKVVRAADAPAHQTSFTGSLTGMCGDCYVTTMILHRRDAEGAVRVSTIRWDDASYAGVPADMIAIYNAVMALRECKPR